MSRVERDCLRVVRGTAGFPLVATVVTSRPWASALFVGCRLTLTVQGDDDARLDDWLVALPDAELTWRGRFVASAEVIARSANAATIELLVVED